MLKNYTAALISYDRKGVTINDEIENKPSLSYPPSHAACYSVCDRTKATAVCAVIPEKTKNFSLDIMPKRVALTAHYWQNVDGDNTFANNP